MSTTHRKGTDGTSSSQVPQTHVGQEEPGSSLMSVVLVWGGQRQVQALGPLAGVAQGRHREQGGHRILLQKVPETGVGKERDVLH